MKILIDARLYGLENAGLGRYIINLIDNLAKIDKKNKYLLILRKKYYNSLQLSDNFEKICFDIRHYSFLEQLVLPFLIYRYKPDLCHFPHFNVPIFYFGKYIVTIHDMLMHKSKGLETTTLNKWQYYIKRIFYYFVFWVAIKKAVKIIVPSNYVKEDLIKNFKVNKSKITITYEG